MKKTLGKIDAFAVKNIKILTYIAAGWALLFFASTIKASYGNIQNLLFYIDVNEGLLACIQLLCILLRIGYLVLGIGLLTKKSRIVHISLTVIVASLFVIFLFYVIRGVKFLSVVYYLADFLAALFILMSFVYRTKNSSTEYRSLIFGIIATFLMLFKVAWGLIALSGSFNFIIFNMCILYAVLAVVLSAKNGLEASDVSKKSVVSAQSHGVRSLDKLMQLKELLDAGIITREEFDEKKKELLGV